MPTRQPVVEILHPLVVEGLRKQTPAQRLQRAFQMWDMAKTMIRGVLRQEHPDWTEARFCVKPPAASVTEPPNVSPAELTPFELMQKAAGVLSCRPRRYACCAFVTGIRRGSEAT